jgi:hypothetical protein
MPVRRDRLLGQLTVYGGFCYTAVSAASGGSFQAVAIAVDGGNRQHAADQSASRRAAASRQRLAGRGGLSRS